MKITTEAMAFLSNDSTTTLADLRTPEGAQRLAFFTCDMSKYGYLFVGKAQITVEFPNEKELIENAVASLREQSAHIRAEAFAKCNAIDGQIQQLLAIEYQPSDQ